MAIRAAGEQRFVGTADRDAVTHVRRRLIPVERLQVVARGHALRKLSQVIARERVTELGLADQQDLQQLFGVRLEVRQQANLLQEFRIEVLGLIDDQDGAPTALVCGQQMAVQRVRESLRCVRPGACVGSLSASSLR